LFFEIKRIISVHEKDFVSILNINGTNKNASFEEKTDEIQEWLQNTPQVIMHTTTPDQALSICQQGTYKYIIFNFSY
jgi:hypothetical protein